MHVKTIAAAAAFIAWWVVPAAAQEVTLRAVTSFAEGTQFSKNFERFIEKVNTDGKGVVKINYIGGPRAMPPFEVGNAVRTKVVDIANVTGAFYTNLMPEADGFKLDLQADERAAQERHLGVHQPAAQSETQRAVPRAPVSQRAVPHLSQQEAGQARLHRAEDPRHAGLQGHRRGAWRHRDHHAAGRGLYRAGARRGRRLRLAGVRHLRSRLGEGDEVSPRACVLQRRGERAGQSRHLEGRSPTRSARC